MGDLKNDALYLTKRFDEVYSEPMDEMKLHRLLYYAQKESFASRNKPLFHEDFYGWKNGPVLKEIREIYKSGGLSQQMAGNFDDSLLSEEEKNILDSVFNEYASISSWSLNRLSHAEYSWKKSRRGVNEYEQSDNLMEKKDIQKDAAYLRFQRQAYRS